MTNYLVISVLHWLQIGGLDVASTLLVVTACGRVGVICSKEKKGNKGISFVKISRVLAVEHCKIGC